MSANVDTIPEWKIRMAQQYFNKGKNETTTSKSIPISAARRALDSSDEDIEQELQALSVSPSSKRTIEVEEFYHVHLHYKLLYSSLD